MTRQTKEPASPESLFGNNLRSAQTAAGLSNRELAQRLSASESQLNKWKRGDVIPRWVTVLRIAAVLGQTPGWFGEDHDKEEIAA